MAKGEQWALDGEGRPLPYTPDQVKAIVDDLVRKGQVLAIVFQVGDDVGVTVFGQPSEELAETLEQTATAYRAGLRGH